MPTIVRSSGGGGTDISALTNAATANQVLEGRQFYGAGSDEPQEGTMVDHSAKTTINVGETGSAGYYSNISVNGASLGNVTAEHVLTNATFTDSNKITQNGSIIIRSDPNANVTVGGTYTNTDAGYYSKITVKGPTLSGNATTDKVLSGYTFYKDSGEKLTGSLASKTMSGTVEVGSTYTNTSAGYYTSVTVTGPTLSGNATTSDVLQNKTFYSSNGSKQTGTIVKRGSATCTSLAAGQTYTGSAGYYDGISIKAAGVSLSGTATNDKVVCGYTYYNTSTTKQTGTMKLWTCSGAIIKGSWTVIDIGFTPTYFGVGFNENSNKNYRLKAYKVGSVLHWTFNGSGTYNGYALAIG